MNTHTRRLSRTLAPLLLLSTLTGIHTPLQAQELQAKFNFNTQQVSTVDKQVFENLQQTLEQFVNDKQWTDLQFQDNERIQCTFNITVTKYDQSANRFTCTALIQANRPVYNAAYTTTIYNNRDKNFDFDFVQFDQLNFNEESIDNQLVALVAYYAFLIIGLDLDTFSPMGGTDVLQRCMLLTNNCQNLDFVGWKSFEDSRNRFAIINDYLDEAMKPFRQLQYDYYRKGLDEMAQNVERGRPNVTTALEKNLNLMVALYCREYLLTHYSNGFRCVTNSKGPVETPDDMKGMLIRTPENQIVMQTGDPSNFLRQWVSDSSNNYGHYSNPEYDALYAQLISMQADSEEAYEIVKQMQTIIAEDGAFDNAGYFVFNLCNSVNITGVVCNGTADYYWITNDIMPA